MNRRSFLASSTAAALSPVLPIGRHLEAPVCATTPVWKPLAGMGLVRSWCAFKYDGTQWVADPEARHFQTFKRYSDGFLFPVQVSPTFPTEAEAEAWLNQQHGMSLYA